MKLRPLTPEICARLERRHARETRQNIGLALEIKSVGDDGTIEGYASVFGVIDSWDDIVAKGAFVASLKEHLDAGTMPAMLWQHKDSEPIGVWLSMVEDAKGLKVTGKLALETVRGKEAYALLKMGALNGLSIGFVAKQWSYDRDTDVRTLVEVDLWEVSLVTFQANKKATVTGIKSAPDDLAAPKDAERALRDAGFSRAEAKTFVSRVMRMGDDQREAGESTAQALQAAERLLKSLSTH